jgi:hypothetical protein
MRSAAIRALPVTAILPLLLLWSSGCDVARAGFQHTETAEWRKTYELQPGGRVEIRNVNGAIEVQAGTGNSVEVVAKKSARGANAEDAKRNLERLEIVEQSDSSSVRVETKPSGSWFGGHGSITYVVRVPGGGRLHFSTVNGGVELSGVSGEITAETTNGGVRAYNVSGSITATTTNGGVEVDLAQLGEQGARLECTNGGVAIRLPADARASISASVSNGGITTSGLNLDTTDSSRRRLEAKLNGGGVPVKLEGVNGGIRISAR